MWNPKTQLWETENVDLFSERQEPYSVTFPTSGMTRRGRLLPLETSAPHIGGNEFLLLPTPGTMDDREKRTTHAAGNLTLQGAVVGVNPVDVERHQLAGRTVRR
jgi:hypothetical protein